MKITRPTEVAVTFDNAQEASRFLYAYYKNEGLERLSFPILTSGDVPARQAAVDAAVRHLAKALSVSGIGPVAPDPQHAAPTYISGSSDKVYLISEMPTLYIGNVLAMDPARQVRGLLDALRSELRTRGESSYKAY